MIRLTLNKQDNTIVVEWPETQPGPAPWRHTVFDSGHRHIIGDLNEEGQIVRVNFGDVDFEGFVFRMVDINGVEWSTEIIGAVVNNGG